MRALGQFVRRYAIVLVFLFVVLMGAIGFRALENETNQRLIDAANLAQDRCESRAQGRDVLRSVVVIATTSNAPLDLTAVAGFDKVDPATRVYLANLSTLLAERGSNDNAALQKQLLDQLPPVTCPGG